MAFLCVDKDGSEWVHKECPFKRSHFWQCDSDCIELPSGTIFKIINKVLTWDDEPVEILTYLTL